MVNQAPPPPPELKHCFPTFLTLYYVIMFIMFIMGKSREMHFSSSCFRIRIAHLFFIIFIIFIMTIVAFACTTFSSHAHGLAAGLSFWLRIAENTHFHNGFCRFHGFSWGPDQSMPGPRNWFIFYYIYYIYYRHHCIPVLVLTPPAESRKIPFIFLLYLLWFIIFIIFIIFI